MINTEITLSDGSWLSTAGEDVRMQITLEYDNNLHEFRLAVRNGIASKTVTTCFASNREVEQVTFNASLKILLEQADFPFTLKDIPEGIVRGLYTDLCRGIEALA